jgi:hypothetical protein
MRKRLLVLIGFFLLSSWSAFAAPKKKASDLSEAELKEFAERELESPPAGENTYLAPSFNSEALGLISTQALEEKTPPRWRKAEAELGVQMLRLRGTGRISQAEPYSLDKLSSRPMGLFGGRYWFWENGPGDAVLWRGGLGLSAGIATHEVKITTSQGVAYDDVRLNSFLLIAGPQAELFLSRSWALGLSAQAGEALLTQSGRAAFLSRSQSAAVYEGGASVRFQPSTLFFSRLGYSRRGTFSSSKELGIQENNYALYLGIGI